jgi:hypothetical protein
MNSQQQVTDILTSFYELLFNYGFSQQYEKQQLITQTISSNFVLNTVSKNPLPTAVH